MGNLNALKTIWPTLSGTTVDKLATLNALQVDGPPQDITITALQTFLTANSLITPLTAYASRGPSAVQSALIAYLPTRAAPCRKSLSRNCLRPFSRIIRRKAKTALGVTRRKAPEATIKEAVLAVLADHPRGLLALDLLAKINAQYGWEIVRPSLSPQLTRLKRERKVVNFDGLWRLPGDPDLFLHTDTKTK